MFFCLFIKIMKKQALGRGLSALIETEPVFEGFTVAVTVRFTKFFGARLKNALCADVDVASSIQE